MVGPFLISWPTGMSGLTGKRLRCSECILLYLYVTKRVLFTHTPIGRKKSGGMYPLTTHTVWSVVHHVQNYGKQLYSYGIHSQCYHYRPRSLHSLLSWCIRTCNNCLLPSRLAVMPNTHLMVLLEGTTRQWPVGQETVGRCFDIQSSHYWWVKNYYVLY